MNRRFPYIFRSYAQAAADVREWSRRLPANIVAVSGIPRSGIHVAAALACHRNIHYVPFEELMAGKRPWESKLRRAVPARKDEVKKGGFVLLIDDTCWSGRTMREIKPGLPPYVKTGVLYAGDKGMPFVDFWHRRVHVFQHTFEWNFLHDSLSRNHIVDLDGTLCEDYTLPGEEGEFEEAYLNHLVNAKPLRIPSYPVLAVCTARLEKYRPQTEAWLKKHGVRYQVLDMGPFDSAAERAAKNGFAHRKAEYYSKRNAGHLFVEDRHDQAMIIARVSGKPVLSLARMELLNGLEPDQPIAPVIDQSWPVLQRIDSY